MRRVAVRSVVISAWCVSLGAVAFIACSSSNRPGGVGNGYDSGTFIGQDGSNATDSGKLSDGSATDGDPCANPGPPLCDPTSTFAGTPTALPGITADVFGSITPDELHIAWVTGVDDAGTVTVHVADRASTGVAFGADLSAALPVAFDRVSLAADGMSAVAATADRTNVGLLTRGAGAAFTGPDETAFNTVRSTNEGGAYRSPVLSADGQTMYVILDNGSANIGITTFMLESDGDASSSWEPGQQLNAANLDNTGSQFRVPTGISFDGRTLFYIDEVNGGTEGAAFRAGPTCPFTQFVSLGARQGAAPNHACSTVYFQGSGSIETAGK